MMSRILSKFHLRLGCRGRRLGNHLVPIYTQTCKNYGLLVHRKLHEERPSLMTIKHYSSNEINNAHTETTKFRTLFEETDAFTVLEKIDDIETLPQNLQPEYISNLCVHLQRTYYRHCSSVGECKSWLLSNVSIAHAQLSMNGCVDQVMKPLTSSPLFGKLLSVIDEQLPSMDVNCKARIGRSLVFLGIETCNPVLQKLYLTLRSDIVNADIGTLDVFSQMMRGFPTDPLAIYNLIQRLKVIFITSSISNSNILELCDLVTNVAQFLTYDLREMVLKEVNKTITETELQSDNELLYTLVRFVNFSAKYVNSYKARLKFNRETTEVKKRQVSPNADFLELYSKIVHGVIGCKKFDTATIYELSRLPGIQLFPQISFKDKWTLRSKLVSEAENLIIHQGKSMQLKDVICLLPAVRHADDDVINRFQNAFKSKLNEGDIDVLLLSRMAPFLESVKPCNLDFDIWKYFELNVGNQVENIVQNKSRYTKLRWLLMKKQIKSIDVKNKLRQATISQLTNGPENFLTSSVLLVSFLLSFKDEALPRDIYQKLLSLFPNLSVRHIAFMASLPEICNHANLKVQYYRNQKLHDQISVIKKELICSALGMVDDVAEIKMMLRLTDVFISKSNNRDSSLTNKLLNKVVQLKDKITEANLVSLLKVFIAVNYHNAETYDHICSLLVENKQTSVMKSFFLIACNAVGYHPKGLNELNDINIDMFYQHKDKDQWFYAIQLISNLVGLQVFPEALLADVFTIDSLENLDNFARENPGLKKGMEHMMMTLNRAVILECPQLDVPWLFADYNFKMAEQRQGLVNHFFFHEVEKALMEILGGKDYLKSNLYSPYGHHIAFEFVLNEFGLPIPVTDSKFNKGTLQRVAVMTWDLSKFCHNSGRLRGMYQTCNRQLQILGYNLLQVPIAEWTSMGLADWSEKVSYMEQKVDTVKTSRS